MEPGVFALVAITLAAAFVNGALGYGFSSLTVPVGLVLFANRVLNPALVLIELLYIWFGLNEGAAIAAVALNKLPQTAVTIREGRRARRH